MVRDILIIGGGIAGVQAALDLADAGAKAVIVEKTPSVGGKMAALDKNFPTLDCSICIEGPKLSEAGSHPNIEILANSEVVKVEGEAGNFTVHIRQRPRFVGSECTRCGECATACPVILPNEFDSSMAARKAIYTPFPQSVPGAYAIDIAHCLNRPPAYLPCSRCMDACKPKVISFDDFKPKEFTRNVASIILSTGYELFDAKRMPHYGYGSHPDIMTAMEFERLLTSAGPSGGEIVKPSDGTHPHSAVFVLCVGSRDVRYNKYCSRFCCMYTIKEAYQAHDHGVKDVKILYMDIRAYGKGFDGFKERAESEGIQFVRGRPAKIEPSKGNRLTIRYENTRTGKLERLETDMVVLATGVEPNRELPGLASILGIERDGDGFVKSAESREGMVATAREGIFAAGGPNGPKDIPDSVAEGTGAAAAALQFVTGRDWPEEKFPPEMEIAGQEPRIGVFLCDCGSNIAGVVNVPDGMEYAKTLPYVKHAEELMFACAANSVDHIGQVVAEKKLNRVVISACSPKTHESIFKKACRKGGLNPFMLEMANVRNMDSWVHKGEPAMATYKSKDMLRMAVGKAIKLSPLYMAKEPVIQKVLVIGGGLAGITAALALGRAGVDTHLVEEKPVLGGLLNDLHELAPSGMNAKEYLSGRLAELGKTKVKVHAGTKIELIGGTVGNFFAKLSTGEELRVGAIILATGANPYRPSEFNYGKDPRVVTNHEVEKGGTAVDGKSVTFVSCVGSRQGKAGCSRYCCESMVHQALTLRRAGKSVRVLAKDIRTFSRHAEEEYYQALKEGVRFFRYDTAKPPQDAIRYADGTLEFHDELLGAPVRMGTDKLVLVCGLTPPESPIYQQLRVARSEDSFLLEKHPKLGPCETASAGIYLAGCSQAPKNTRDTISQALGAVAKAGALVSKPFIEKEPITARVHLEKCNGCTLCTRVCPYNAIAMVVAAGEKRGKAVVNTGSCMGCGTCTAECNRDAISTPYFEDDQLYAQIDAALSDKPEEKCIVFACNWCSYAGADQAGIEKLQYPSVGRIIRTMCSGRIRGDFIYHAFQKGAGAVLVTGCHINDCHYITANHHTKRRFDLWYKRIGTMGIAPERLQLQWISAAEGKEFAAKLREMDAVVRRYRESLKNNMEKKAERQEVRA